MSDNKKQGEKKSIIDGYSPLKKGYQPSNVGKAIGGHQPEKGVQKPSNPPKKR